MKSVRYTPNGDTNTPPGDKNIQVLSAELQKVYKDLTSSGLCFTMILTPTQGKCLSLIERKCIKKEYDLFLFCL
jgi:hypothetical protein